MENKLNFKLPTQKQQQLYETLNNYEDKFNNQYLQQQYQYMFNKNLNMIPTEFKKQVLNSIISNNLINKLLLIYELNYLNLKVELKTVEESTKFLNYCFNRYTYKAGGQFFKSPKWEIKKKQENTIVYYNIINDDYLHDSDTVEFLNLLFNFYNRCILNYSIHMEKYYLNRDNLHYIFFIFVKQN